MSVFNRLRTAWDALRQLGIEPVALAGLYRFGLLTGHYQRMTPAKGWRVYSIGEDAAPLKTPPAPDAQMLLPVIGTQIDDLTCEAEEICSGRVRLFGADPVPLNFTPVQPLSHWTAYETRRAPWGVEDVKFCWEPARLGWALTLARAYAATGNAAFASVCHQQLQAFLTGNPPNLGPNWASAQEVGLRIIVLALIGTMLKNAPIPPLTPCLPAAISAHAERIPPTLVYARAQNNNHLLSEAVGLYTAGVILPHHSHAAQWRKLGWYWANHCFQYQIAADGTYNQHSANYHRMMLQLALWFKRMADQQGDPLPERSKIALARATEWLIARLDPISGKVPNLGHNDGGYILPLAAGGFHDFRPVTQAASCAFLGSPCLPTGAWDEMSLWFGLSPQLPITPIPEQITPHCILRSAASWASLRAAHYATRPGQADQLHVNIWWQGEPVTLDAGTYQYNAAPPWENALAGTLVHNTVTVNEQDQMHHAGRFLWLDWAQAEWLPSDPGKLMAAHDGYARRFHIRHRRELSNPFPDTWLIRDWLEPTATHTAPLIFTLHWLLPDLPYQQQGSTLHLTAPQGVIRISIDCPTGSNPTFQLIRAGEALSGSTAASPILGWNSPTYSVKVPALSLRVQIQSALWTEFTTRFDLTTLDAV